MNVLNKVPVREQDAKERATNFEEVCLGYNKEEAMEEASRCINCKNAQCIMENEAAYEEALENYEDAKATAEASLAQTQTNLELLKIQLEEAQIEYEKQQVSSQSDYDAAVSESSSAQETYQTEIDRIDDEISVALNAKEEADENLQEFEEVIGDGYLYTTSAGTVMMVNVREETDLTGGSMVLAYSNPETVTVTASVEQEDIASIEIGEEAVLSLIHI